MKTYYLAVYGKNQIPFPSLEALKDYIQSFDELFKSFDGEVKFFKIDVEPLEI